MEIIKIKNTEVELYDNPNEITILRYHEFNKNILRETGIGSDMAGIMKRFEEVTTFLKAGMQEQALIAFNNLIATHYSLLNGIDYKSRSLACLVKRIGNTEYLEVNDANIMRIIERLNELGLTHQRLVSILQKKKRQ